MTMRRPGTPDRPYPMGRPPTGARPPFGGGSFTDRVMARVAAEPTPSPARVFFRSLGHLAMRDALAALVTAWRLAFEPASRVSAGSRASAAALFLSVIVFVGLGGAAVTGGALALLGSDGRAPVQLAPGASPSPRVDIVEASPSMSPQPSRTPLVTPSPAPTPTPTAEPAAEVLSERATPRPTRKPQRDADEAESSEREDREKRETPEPKEREREKEDDD